MTRAEKIEAAARALMDHPLAHEAPTRAAFDALRAALAESDGTCLCGATIAAPNENGIWVWPKGHAGYHTHGGCRAGPRS